MKHEIRKTLVCSTAHVSRSVMMLMDRDGESNDQLHGCIHNRLDFGWLIRWWIPKEDDLHEWLMLPRCLKDVIERAEGLGCSMVMFDADADTLEGVRTYEW